MLASLPGPDLPPETARLLERGLAGVVLFARNIESRASVRALCQAVREVKPDALIALDEEGGEVTRLEAATGSSWPGARVLGVVDDLELTAKVARRIADQVATVGANVNFGPVADVASETANPVVGNRSFGADAGLVGRHVAAWVEAAQSAGVAACAKHFPGHGATTVDSHLDLPTVRLSREALWAEHIAPFVAAKEAGVAMLMTAHVRYPEIDELPATLSRAVLRGLARDEVGFEGVMVTDALGMAAISGHAGLVPGAVMALAAGADLLLLADGSLEAQREVIAGLRDAVTTGEIPTARLEEAAERTSRLASAFAPRQPPSREPPVDALGLHAARLALAKGPLPPALSLAPYVVELAGPRSGVGETKTRLLDALRQRNPATAGLLVSPGDTPDAELVLEAARGRSLVVATRDSYRKAGHREFVAAVLAARPDTVVVGLGSEADAALAPGSFVAARGAAPPNIAAAAEVLLPGSMVSP